MRPPERRQFGRRETLKHGTIRIAGRPGLPCRIRNACETGAFLELQPPSWLPFYFTLDIASNNRTFNCELRHARPNGIGVNFIAPSDILPEPIDFIAAVGDIEEWCGQRRRNHPAKVK